MYTFAIARPANQWPRTGEATKPSINRADDPLRQESVQIGEKAIVDPVRRDQGCEGADDQQVKKAAKCMPIMVPPFALSDSNVARCRTEAAVVLYFVSLILAVMICGPQLVIIISSYSTFYIGIIHLR